MTRQVVLLVEPNPRVADIIQESIRPLAQVYHHLEFESARRRLGAVRFDFVVSNLRLGAFNGLHLALRRQRRRRDAVHHLHRIAGAGAGPGRAARGRVLRSLRSPACDAARLPRRQPAVRRSPRPGRSRSARAVSRRAADLGPAIVRRAGLNGRRPGTEGSALRGARDAGFDPASRARHQLLGFDGPSASGVVLVERQVAAQHAIDDTPRRFDAGFAAKQRAVAAQRVAEAGVRTAASRRPRGGARRGARPRRPSPRRASCPRRQRDADVGAQAEAELVRVAVGAGVEQRAPPASSAGRALRSPSRPGTCPRGSRTARRASARLSIASRAAT